MSIFLSLTTGDYVLNFFKEFIGTPAILIGLFALVGCLLQRKKFTETISATIKTTIGFLIIGGGAGILAGAVGKLGNAFNLLFGINGIIANNDVIPGLFLNSLPKIVLAGALIMICAMLLNIVLACITSYKYIYLTGHVLFYLSVMFASVLNLAGLNLAEDLPIIVITGALLVSLWMIISPALLNKYVIKITKSDTLAVGHTGSLSYLFSAWIGILITKISRKPLKSTEEIKFPKGLSFLRNNNIAIAITMFFLYLIIYFTAWGVNGYDALVKANILNTGQDVFVQGLLQSFTFAAGVEVLLIGVRMFIAKIVPSFKGISQKLVPNAKAALDCPTMFPYAQNAVLIGFIASFLGGIIGMAITIIIVHQIGWQDHSFIGRAIVIPSIVPHFFVGATAGVFGNAYGGIWGAIFGPFLNGILMTFIPFLFFGLKYMHTLTNTNGSLNGLTWGDSDFLLGLPIAGLGQLVGRKVSLWLLPVLAITLWLILPLLNLITFFAKKKHYQSKPLPIKTNLTLPSNQPITVPNLSLKTYDRKKLVAVCGQGLGSSLLIEMNIKKLVQELNLPHLEVSHTNVNAFDATDQQILAVICGTDLADSIPYQDKIMLDNLLDETELKEKLVRFLQEYE
ncbi:PTS system ascorbate-specific transporter IICB component [Spiroplasma melliferum IPMB4A]|uniref:PTS sugar transporter subunit IIC n=1 Tax=Spiroplasma melliferum TaxID=2134 RepID=UPI0002A621CE|nr:PTS sugar transporter subunit IIC [Spiroplasma melliferum]ELL44639.1 PTS system ascorbate-specific transporter IICB component [Spiroplasma melliferum IPMB4A]